MKLLKISFIFLLFMAGCADIDYKIPAHRFMDPETSGGAVFNGEIHGFAQMSFQRAHKVTMTEIYDAGVFGLNSIDDKQTLSKTTSLGIQAGLGLFPIVDLIYRNNDDSPTMLISKVQLIGDGAKEKSEGFKLSIWAGAGSMSQEETDLQVTDAGNNETRTYSGKLEVDPWEVGLTLGQRVKPNFLLYISAVHAVYPSESRLTSNTNPTTQVNGEATQNTANLGAKIDFNKHSSCHLEVGHGEVTWKNDLQTDQNVTSLSGALSLKF